MGTPGYLIYRHRGWCIAMFCCYDSYPEGLGLSILNLIPDEPQEFERWLRAIRAKLDIWLLAKGATQIKPGLLCVPPSVEEPEPSGDGALGAHDSKFAMTGEYKRFELGRCVLDNWMMAYTYEIDLDNLLLRVDDTTFPLNHRPSIEEFLLPLLDDESDEVYINPDTVARLPSQNVSAPCVEDLAFYDWHVASGAVKPIHELLGTSKCLTRIEDIRAALLEVVVGTYVMSHDRGTGMFSINAYRDRNGLLDAEASTAESLCLLDVALSPPFCWDRQRFKAHKDDLALVWLRADTCVWLAVRLDHTQTMKAAISQLVSAVFSTTTKQGLVFGIVFSLSHIIVVTIDTSNRSFHHTPPLQFLPLSYATSPATPGIEALARVACRPDPSFALGLRKGQRRASWTIHPTIMKQIEINFGNVPINYQVDSTVQKLPDELWCCIAAFILDPADLITLAKVSRQCRNAAVEAVRTPRISDIVLTKRAPTLIGKGQLDRWFGAQLADFVRFCFASFEVYTTNEEGKPIPTRLTIGPQGQISSVMFNRDGSKEKVVGGADLALRGVLYEGDERLQGFSYVLL